MIPQTPIFLAAWLHDWSPFIVEFGTGFGLRWYGTAYALGFLVAWLLLRWLSRRGVTPLSEQRITDAMLMICLGVVIGGRLGYVVFYEPSLLWTFTDSPPWWGLLQVNKGGMASHGGMIGVLVGCWLVARGTRSRNGERMNEVPVRHMWDLCAFVTPPGLLFGRLANFINGELLGDIVARPGEAGPWWSVKFPQELFTGHAPVLSAEQQEALTKLLDKFRLPGQTDYGAYERMLHTLQSGAKAQAADLSAQLAPLLASRHPSQLYQAFAEGIVLWAALALVWLMPRKPGSIAAAFLIVYGVLRILTELYRLPDAQFVVQRYMGLSRGQWLSVAMIAGGLVMYACATRLPGVKTSLRTGPLTPPEPA